jgi:hypothetical protein
MPKFDVASIIPVLFWIGLIVLGAVMQLVGEKGVVDRAHPITKTVDDAFPHQH